MRGALRSKARALQTAARARVTHTTLMVLLTLYRLSGRRLFAGRHLYLVAASGDALALLPGMTTASELAYFRWHCQELVQGHGQVVDLGSWFGSTTAALAMGLEANTRPAVRGIKVHAYDRFQWEWWMDQYAELAAEGPYSPGDSFLREFHRVVGPWQGRIVVHEGDLLQQRWNDGGIEVLLVDAMKSWELARHILTAFYPFLIPGHGHVLHQDFAHCYTPWIHLIAFRLRDHLVPVRDVLRSDTVAFRLHRPFEQVEILDLNRASFDDDEVREAFLHSLRITRPEKHSAIHASHAMLLVYDGDLAGARTALRRLESKGQLRDFDSTAVRGAIENAERGGPLSTSTALG